MLSASATVPGKKDSSSGSTCGWMVLEGRTDVGTVVAATIGLGRIQGPTAFLIAFYRQVSANRIKFELLREVLQPDADPARR